MILDRKDAQALDQEVAGHLSGWLFGVKKLSYLCIMESTWTRECVSYERRKFVENDAIDPEALWVTMIFQRANIMWGSESQGFR